MQENKKYDILFLAMALLWTTVFTGLGLLALIEKRIYLVGRFHESLFEGVHAEVMGWILLATGLYVLAYQLRSSNYLLSFYAVYVGYFVSLILYILFRVFT